MEENQSFTLIPNEKGKQINHPAKLTPYIL